MTWLRKSKVEAETAVAEVKVVTEQETVAAVAEGPSIEGAIAEERWEKSWETAVEEHKI